jgi:hypothetical protein
MADFSFINNNSGSVYFTMETVRNNQGVYDNFSSASAVGVYSNFIGINVSHLVTSSYIFAEVIPPGSSSFTFTPTNTINTGAVYFKGTGNLTVTITI